MQINYILEKEDVLDFHLYLTKNQKSKKTRIYIYGGLALALFGYHIYQKWAVENEIPYFALIWLAIIGFSFLLMPLIVKRNLLRNLNKPENADIFGPIELKLGNKDVEIIKPNYQTKLNWSDFLKLVETEKYYFLFNSENSAIVVAKEKLKEKKVSFGDLVKSKIS